MASEFVAWSPYSYTFNNPILFIDPDGRAPELTSSDPPPKFYQKLGDAAFYLLRGEAVSDLKSFFSLEEGTPNASDYHDSGDTQPAGLEQTTSTELKANGTAETPTATEGATGIVDTDGLSYAAGGNSGKMLKTMKAIDADIGLAISVMRGSTETVRTGIVAGNKAMENNTGTHVFCNICKDTFEINNPSNSHTNDSYFSKNVEPYLDTISQEKE